MQFDGIGAQGIGSLLARERLGLAAQKTRQALLGLRIGAPPHQKCWLQNCVRRRTGGCHETLSIR